MKSFGIVLILAGVVLATLPVQAADETGQTSFTLVGKSNAGGYAWFLNGAGDPNPTLTVPANTQITFTVSSTDDTPHTFQVGGKLLSDAGGFQQSDGTKTFTWTSGSADTTYVCTFHPDMKGTIHVAGSGSGTETKKSPGTALVGSMLALAGVALVMRRQK